MNKHYPHNTLYGKISSGKIQEWDVYIIEKSSNEVILVTEYGQINGKKIQKLKPIKSTKSKRTPLEQAFQEAKTKWNEKINKNGYFQDKKKCESTLVIRPMLAEKYSKHPNKIKFPCLIQPKLDGNRALVHKTKTGVIIESRSGTEIKFFDHIRAEVDILLGNKIDNFYLDGEIFTQELQFNELNGLTNKTVDMSEDVKKQMTKMKYNIFDCFDLDKMALNMVERNNLLKDLFKKHKFKHLILVPTDKAKDKEEIEKYHDKFINKLKYEGTILRNCNGKYELKKRSHDLLKYVDDITEEFVIVGYHESQDDEKGTVVWECRSNKNPDVTFSAKPKGEVEYRSKLLKEADKYIGKLLTVSYREYTDKKNGIPRFPIGKDIRYPKDLD